MAPEPGSDQSAEQPRTPVVPRRSASLLLVRDDPLRVLMLRRGSSRGAFPSALVFPGGVLEKADWDWASASGSTPTTETAALRATAIRETWEEVGVLLARNAAGDTLEGASVNTPSAVGEAGLAGALAAAGAKLALDELVPFGRWITPLGGGRRFDTDFFLARAPAGQEPTADGVEAVAIRWVRPAEVSELTSEMLLLPTLMNLKRLGEHATVAQALAAAPSYPNVPVTSTVGFDADGAPIVRIPAEAGYGVTEFRPKDAGHYELER